ncbi:hypothetical protein DFH08DRAFT_729665 [Mycena albidolilacea]|uniref:F-box domain-containing protein n=1 Tax=Mycena albidolilacea TaxID=1033008 RepID=A0AAD7F5P2_9AGAR|nr:hypothetical protein DFH08DRAFT_729665 [Mycena albidolilacea]
MPSRPDALVLQDLKQTRSERELHATAYPVLTLPIEITTEIFLRCFLVFDPLCIPQCTSSAAIILTGVCRAWRDIALATPILWSRLEVFFDLIATRVASEPFLVESFIDRWLSRAGNCPLSLCLLSFEYELSTLDRLRDIIYRWSHRVQHLDLQIGCPNIRLLGLDSTRFPLLESATLHFLHEADPSLSHPVVIFSNAPRFHQLHLQTVLTPSTFMLPWLHLTKFEGIITSLELFTIAPSLTEVTVSFSPRGVLPMEVIHGGIKSLTGTGNDLIRYLTLPALRSLNIYGTTSYGSLESFLARSSPPLVSLSVRKNTTETCLGTFEKCMSLVAGTLESLKLQQVSTRGVLSALYAAPNLRTLDFDDVYHQPCLFALVDFLYARSDTMRTVQIGWASETFLDRLTMAGPPGPESDSESIRDRLSRLARTGMDIRLGSSNRTYPWM